MQTPRFGETQAMWFAAQVWAGREQFCAQHLRARGYDVFLPTYAENRRWSDRIKTVNRALFPGYVFCRMRPQIAGMVVRTPGVIGVVGDGRRPLPIPDGEIDAVQRIVASRLAVGPTVTFRAGQTVRVEVGPLTGVRGVIVRVKGQNRMIVSIPLLQRSVAVEIDSAWVSVPTAPVQRRTVTATD